MNSEALQKRQIELLEQLVKQQGKTQTHTATSADVAQRQSRLISLAIIWGFIGVAGLYMLSLAAYDKIANSRAGQWLGLATEMTAVAPSLAGSNKPLKKGDTVGDWVVTSGMGPRQSPGGVGSTNHAGVDLAHKNGPGQTMGAPMYAPFDTGVKCGQTGKGGIEATIEGAGVKLRMLHLAQCKPGQVGAGQVFAAVGNTGTSTTGPHLHLEQYEGGGLVNPTEKWAAALLGVQASAGGIDLGFIQGLEGFSATAYDDGAQTSIGYGTHAKGRATITREQAEAEMVEYLQTHCLPIIPSDLPGNKVTALASFCYNLGPAQAQNTDLWRFVMAGNYGAVDFTRYTRATTGVSLLPRRQKEQSMWNGN